LRIHPIAPIINRVIAATRFVETISNPFLVHAFFVIEQALSESKYVTLTKSGPEDLFNSYQDYIHNYRYFIMIKKILLILLVMVLIIPITSIAK